MNEIFSPAIAAAMTMTNLKIDTNLRNLRVKMVKLVFWSAAVMNEIFSPAMATTVMMFSAHLPLSEVMKRVDYRLWDIHYYYNFRVPLMNSFDDDNDITIGK